MQHKHYTRQPPIALTFQNEVHSFAGTMKLLLRCITISCAAFMLGCSANAPAQSAVNSSIGCTQRDESRTVYLPTNGSDASASLQIHTAAMAFAADAQQLLVAFTLEPSYLQGRVVYWSFPDMRPVNAVVLDQLGLRLTRFSNDRKIMVSIPDCPQSESHTCSNLQMWDTKTWQMVSVHRTRIFNYTDVSVSPDTKYVMTAAESIGIYDPRADYGGLGYSFPYEGYDTK